MVTLTCKTSIASAFKNQMLCSLLLSNKTYQTTHSDCWLVFIQTPIKSANKAPTKKSKSPAPLMAVQWMFLHNHDIEFAI